MSNKEYLKEYVRIIERHYDTYTNYEKDVITYVRTNPELDSIVREIDSAYTAAQKYAIIEKYSEQLIPSKKDEKETIIEAIQTQFNIKIDEIEFKKLKDGTDIIAFLDPSYGRKRLIEYNFSRSLSKEFTDIQNSNELYQSDDPSKNANNIAKAEAKIERELKMYDVSYLMANFDKIVKEISTKNMNALEMLNRLLRESQYRGIKYINVDHMVALTEKGDIVEASLNRDNQIEIGSADTYKTTDETSITSGNLSMDSSITPDVVITDAIQPEEDEIDEDEELVIAKDIHTKDVSFRSIVKEEMAKNGFPTDDKSVDKECNKVINYSKDMSKLSYDYEQGLIDEQHFDFYQNLCVAYSKTTNLEKTEARNLVLEKEKGYISILIMAYIAIMISMLALLLINF